ncbi:hypothetical protein [Flavobacterium luteum]|uniref:Uncharacterized protein n=1 Tax=Flavobacterium luteum TaxID=2026654 RepID=A0A7J5A969_9FLAO|nr:hypothetical protein [Flavobacterium luteum]KAB1154077.1 hypothetical protein F6464_13305 [Flavobacterium luteum]
MKTNVPKQFINYPSTFMLFEKPAVLFMKRLLLLLIILFFNVTISGQTRKIDIEAPKIMEVKTYISTLKNNNLTSRKSKPEKTNLEKLLYDVQPSIYFNNGVIKTYGENPKNFFVEFQNLNKISNSNLLKNNIEIVTIKINSNSELNSAIDLSVFSSFKKLKYVYISSNVAVNESTISKMIRNYNEKYTVFYTIENGDNSQ